MNFDICKVIDTLKEKRIIFTSEADFQLELGWVIKSLYPDAKVRMEYSPKFNPDMHIDILVIIDGSWIPIELKYKTKGCTKYIDDEEYILKNHGAKDVNCYLYLKDIQRIESVKKAEPRFQVGYTIFLTNDPTYPQKPRKANCVYSAFSLDHGTSKTGCMDWNNASAGTKKGNEQPICLCGSYTINWREYGSIDCSNTGKFMILVNEIR